MTNTRPVYYRTSARAPWVLIGHACADTPLYRLLPTSAQTGERVGDVGTDGAIHVHDYTLFGLHWREASLATAAWAVRAASPQA